MKRAPPQTGTQLERIVELDRSVMEKLAWLARQPLLVADAHVAGRVDDEGRSLGLVTQDDERVVLHSDPSILENFGAFDVIEVVGDGLYPPLGNTPSELWVSGVVPHGGLTSMDVQVASERLEPLLYESMKKPKATPRRRERRLWAADEDFREFLNAYEARRARHH